MLFKDAFGKPRYYLQWWFHVPEVAEESASVGHSSKV